MDSSGLIIFLDLGLPVHHLPFSEAKVLMQQSCMRRQLVVDYTNMNEHAG